MGNIFSKPAATEDSLHTHGREARRLLHPLPRPKPPRHHPIPPPFRMARSGTPRERRVRQLAASQTPPRIKSQRQLLILMDHSIITRWTKLWAQITQQWKIYSGSITRRFPRLILSLS